MRSAPELVLLHVDQQVYRIGYAPAPWAWSGWEFAGTDGRFPGRWDDDRGVFRTVYAGSTLLGCLLEVLAHFRPDPALAAEMAGIEDEEGFPTAPAGHVPHSWLDPREAASATLRGTFCDVTATESIAALRPAFIALVHQLGQPDFDAAALRRARPRELTQRVATHLHATTDVAGVRFVSRHGDEVELWAIFEHAGDRSVSPHLSDLRSVALPPDHPELVTAFRLHGLTWAEGT